ncbi:MAG: hypothetical protein LBE34_09875 [Flavobacteriaceae bacterium]|jgi:archaellum component FlaF (FlaF/FlaG flagellin family)|nr:hypothetical protein [Flavobacteriaceae bacterium]
MIIYFAIIMIVSILILSAILISKVLKVYLITTKNKELWKKEIREEKDYQFIKGLY